MTNKDIDREKAVKLKKAIIEQFKRYEVELTKENLLLLFTVSKSASPPLISDVAMLQD